MTKFWLWPIRLFCIIRGFFPMKLPAGRPDFERLVTFICRTYGFPNTPGYRRAIIQFIMHTQSPKATRTPVWYCRAIINGQAKQTVFEIDQEMRAEDKKRQDAIMAELNKKADEEKAAKIASGELQPEVPAEAPKAKSAIEVGFEAEEEYHSDRLKPDVAAVQ